MTGALSLETIPHEIGKPAGLIRRLAEALTALTQSQHENAFLWLPVVFACGIGAYFSLPFEPPLWPFVVVTMTLLSGLMLTKRTAADRVNPAFIWLCIGTLVSGGFLSAKLRTLAVHTPILEKKIKFADLTATIESVEALPGKKGSRVVLSDIIIEKLALERTPRKIRLQIRKDENLQTGQRIKVLAELNPPSDALLPGGFDFRRAMYFQGIGAVGFAFKAPEIVQNPSALAGVEALRQKIAQIIMESLPGSEGAVVAALTIGQKKGIPEADEEALRDAGLAHLLAISGLHVGLVAGFVFFVVRFLMALSQTLALRYPIKKLAAVIACICAFFFMMIAGATIPTQRAVLMISIVFLGVIMDRVALSLRLLSFAALVVLAIAPESLLSASFQMSFAAVAALIAAYETTRERWVEAYVASGPIKRAAIYFIGVSFSSLVASAATAPISAYHFNQIAFLGIIANLGAIPLMAFLIMPAAVVAFILMPFGLADGPLQLMGWGVAAILETARVTASLPGAVLHTQGWPFSAFLLIVVAGLMLILWRGWAKAASIPLVMLAGALIAVNPQPDILIASEGRLAAFRGEDRKLYATTVRSQKFTLDNWERSMGQAEDASVAFAPESKPQAFQEAKTGNGAGPMCDAQACRTILKERKISFLRQAYAQKEECGWADIVVSFEPVLHKPCRAAIVIDKFDQWRYGAHAIYIKQDENKILVKTNREISATQRPWSAMKPERNEKKRAYPNDQES